MCALDDGVCESEEADQKVLQSMGEDDGAKIVVRTMRDDAIDDGERGQREDGAEAFIEMHRAKECGGDEDRERGAACPGEELLEEIAAEDELFTDAGAERDAEPEQELQGRAGQHGENEGFVPLMGQRRLEQGKRDQGDGDEAAEIDGNAETETLCECVGAAAKSPGEEGSALMDTGEDEGEEDPLEQHGGGVVPGERGWVKVGGRGAGSADDRGDGEQREERDGV